MKIKNIGIKVVAVIEILTEDAPPEYDTAELVYFPTVGEYKDMDGYWRMRHNHRFGEYIVDHMVNPDLDEFIEVMAKYAA